MEETKTVTARVRPVLPAHAFVFIASFSLMVIELVAGRIMAPYLGSSLYTWTSVIGVILAGITVGNWAGGQLAEKGADWRMVGLVFAFAGFAAAAGYYLSMPVSDVIQDLRLPLPFATVLFAVASFLPVSFLLSLVTPIVITLSIPSLEKAGSTVGGIYAVSALASILGTFLTGYVLIAAAGVRIIMLVTAAVLLLTGILLAADRRLTVSAITVGTVAMLWVGLFMAPDCKRETAYYCIRISQFDKNTKAFVLDHLIHSLVTADPRDIQYGYETDYAVATEYAARARGSEPLRALFLGGGAYVMPKYALANYPDAQVTTVEIDPGVLDEVRRDFGLDPEGRMKNVIADARMFMARPVGDPKYDIIYGDVFNDYAIPFHLTTEEYMRLVRARLAPGGIYAINTIDSNAHGRLLASFIKTARTVFGHVTVLPVTPDWKASKRTTFVLIAGDAPFDPAEWSASADATYAKRLALPPKEPIATAKLALSDAEVEDFLATHRGMVLTDDHVPIDNLLADVYGDSVRK